MGSFRQSTVTVRDARRDDAPQIAQLGSHVFSLTFGHSVEPHQLQAYLDEAYNLEATMADISDPSKHMIVATNGENSNIVGFALLNRASTEPCIEHLPKTVELQRIYVDPGAHGKGVGKLLADRLEAMARDERFSYMWLGVWEENFKALKAYEKWGYKRIGEHDFDVGGVVQTDHIMFKQL